MTSTTDWALLQPYLPQRWLAALAVLPAAQQAAVQELRLRAEQPLAVSLPAGERYLCRDGLTALRQPGLLRCSARELEGCFLRFCQESVYAHEAELRQGYLTVPGGLRVGVAGTASPGGVRQVTSLCVRLPRRHAGCAAGLLPLVDTPAGLQNTLLVGEPSSGKTTLLRDLAARLAARGRRVAVADERGEIAGVDGLPGCDVLRGGDKPAMIRQAIRTLAPQAVVFDELGSPEEVEAIAACAYAGVAVISSLHGREATALQRQPLVQLLARRQTFSRWIFLAGRQTPGRWVQCLRPEVEADEVSWTVVGGRGGDRPRPLLFPAAVSAGGASAAACAAAGDPAAAADLYGAAAFRPVAAAGGR